LAIGGPPGTFEAIHFMNGTVHPNLAPNTGSPLRDTPSRSDTSGGGAARFRAAWRLLAAMLSLSVVAVIELGLFVPLDRGRGAGVEYVFLWPGGISVVAAIAGSVVGVALLYSLIVGTMGRTRPERREAARSASWMVPAMPLGLLALGLLPAAPGVGARAAVLAYVLYELRWWWVAAALLGVAVRLQQLYSYVVVGRLRAPDPAQLGARISVEVR
jgi:hypothetical protein